ncbi:hypothetical protein BaRGS_00018495, partial [Batillaria attramentaria]
CTTYGFVNCKHGHHNRKYFRKYDRKYAQKITICFLVCGGEEDHEARNNRPVSGDVGGSDSHNGHENFEDAGSTSMVENPQEERPQEAIETFALAKETTRRPDTEPKTENAPLLRRKNTVPIESK